MFISKSLLQTSFVRTLLIHCKILRLMSVAIVKLHAILPAMILKDAPELANRSRPCLNVEAMKVNI